MDLRDMGTDNKIDACYLAQAQNKFKQLKLNQKGVKVKEEAMQLFSALPFGASKYSYIESIDTNKDGSISVIEYAKFLQRAGKEALSGQLHYDKTKKNDGKVSETEIWSDFAQYGATPFLLGEAKKFSPEKYAQIEQRLKTGTFAVTGERDDNLFREKLDGANLVTAISKATQEYETIEVLFPNVKKPFFDKLAKGEVLKFVMPSSTMLDTDSFEKKAAQEICKNAFSDEKLEGYYKDILDTVDDKQKFSRFTKSLGEDIKNVLKVNPSIAITDEKFEEQIGFYDEDKNQITISSPYFTSLKESMKNKGDSEDEIKQELLRATLEVVSHEYLHAAQYVFIKNPPTNATPEELAVLTRWRKNLDNYLTISDSKKLYGSKNEYAKQPAEKSAYNLMIDIDMYLQKWFDNRKDKKILTLKQENHASKGS
jgi:hypothetical protein